MNSYDKKPYEKDHSYDKSKDNSVTVKKIKCNNINVNLNGFSGNTIDTAPPGLAALATEAQAEDEGANGASGNNGREGGDGRSSGHDSNSRFICINNNDNSGGATDDGEEQSCDDCVAAISPQLRTAINDILDGADPVTIPGTQPPITIDANNVDELCEELSADPISLNQAQIDGAIMAFAGGDPALTAQAEVFVNCLIDAGAIIKLLT